MPAHPLTTTLPVLLLIDLQNAIDHPAWRKCGPANNSAAAEQNIANLLQAWRTRGGPIYHIRHDSLEPKSPYRPRQPGNDFKAFAMPQTGEPVVAKQTNSAFIGTPLEEMLRAAGHRQVVICGVITNNSVEATVRMAGNLGFETYLVADGCYTFARMDWDGRLCSAEQVHALSLANMNGEYCQVLTTRDIRERFAL